MRFFGFVKLDRSIHRMKIVSGPMLGFVVHGFIEEEPDLISS